MLKYIYFSLFLVLYSCSDFGKSGQLDSIEKMTKTIDSLSIVLEEYPIDKIEEISFDFAQNEEKIQLNLKSTDTINLDLGKKLDALKKIRFSFRPLKEMNEKLHLDFKNELKVLNNLKNDIASSNGERVNYSKNVEVEIKKVNELKNLLLTYTKKREEAIIVYNKYKIDLEQFANTISQN
jgi:hypothetical protein